MLRHLGMGPLFGFHLLNMPWHAAIVAVTELSMSTLVQEDVQRLSSDWARNLDQL
jgi:hypothetical protein